MAGCGYRDLGPVIKSPLDRNDYRVMELSNGMKAFLISTCARNPPPNIQKGSQHPETCAFMAVQEFNHKYLNMCPDPDFKIPNTGSDNKASTKSKPKQSSTKSTGRNKKTTKNSQKVKCMANKEDRVGVVLAIGSGVLNDPKELPGLAHLTEHSVFHGSLKYPQLEALTTFCQKSGGDANGRTNMEFTAFDFNLEKASDLEEGLKILLDAVTNPKLDEVVQEIESINSEYHMKIFDDDNQYLALLLSFINPEHPLQRLFLGLGSRKSLNNPKILDLTARLKDWMKKNYVPNNMCLCIEAPMGIKELSDVVVSVFGALPTSSCSCIPRTSLFNKFKDTPITTQCEWNRLTYLMPISHHKFLKIAWKLNPLGKLDYRTKPFHFLSYLITSKAPGGLDHYLKSKGWVLDVDTCCSPNSQEYGYCSTMFCTFFILTLKLTHQGLQNWKEVANSTFSYLQMIRESGVPNLKRVFGEMQQTNADTFHYRSDNNIVDSDPINKLIFDVSPRENDISTVLNAFAEALIEEVDPKEVLTSQLVTMTFNIDLILQYLNQMTQKMANFVVGGEAIGDLCTDTERLSGCKGRYKTIKMDSNLKSQLERFKLNKQFRLPPKNEFIQRSMCYPKEGTGIELYGSETTLFESTKMRVFYGDVGCRKGYLPTAVYKIDIGSPLVLDTTVFGVIQSMAVWTKCLSYIVTSKLGTALHALVECNIEFDENATKLCIELTGPSNCLPEIFGMVIRTFQSFDTEIENQKWVFDIMAEAQLDDYEDLIFTSETFGEDLLQNVIISQKFTLGDYSHFLIDFEFEDFMEFVATFKEFLYTSVSLSGCISKSDGEKAVEISKLLTPKSWILTRDMVKLNTVIKLPIGERCLRVKSNNHLDNNNLVINHYQYGNADEMDGEILNTLLTSLKSFAEMELRSKERIGYLVEVSLDAYHSVAGINVKCNSSADRLSPGYVDEKIDKCMADFFVQIVSNKAEYDSKIGEKLKELKIGVTQKDVKSLFLDRFLPGGSNYRKVSIQIVGTAEDPKCKPQKGSRQNLLVARYKSSVMAKADNRDPLHPWALALSKDIKEENGYFITHLTKFKNIRSCYANLIPFEDFTIGDNNDPA